MGPKVLYYKNYLSLNRQLLFHNYRSMRLEFMIVFFVSGNYKVAWLRSFGPR